MKNLTQSHSTLLCHHQRHTPSVLLPRRTQDSMDQWDGITLITSLISELYTSHSESESFLHISIMVFILPTTHHCLTSTSISFNTRSDYYKMLIGGDPSKSDPEILEDLIEVSLIFSSIISYISKLSAPHKLSNHITTFLQIILSLLQDGHNRRLSMAVVSLIESSGLEAALLIQQGSSLSTLTLD